MFGPVRILLISNVSLHYITLCYYFSLVWLDHLVKKVDKGHEAPQVFPVYLEGKDHE